MIFPNPRMLLLVQSSHRKDHKYDRGPRSHIASRWVSNGEIILIHLIQPLVDTSPVQETVSHNGVIKVDIYQLPGLVERWKRKAGFLEI